MANSFSITLTPAQVSAAADHLLGAGLSQFGGTLPEQHGVILSYQVEHKTNTVTFTIVKKPALVTVSMIERHVKGLLGI